MLTGRLPLMSIYLRDTTLEPHSIYPGDSFQEFLEFEPPVTNIEWLHLELPANNFGGVGMIRFEISANKIVQDSN